ncbi:receptor-like protein 33 isoform X1 [Salvia hispanica]|uniref:receptor-like protein 33 isoform X1 n=1 Tax=Salvia hispanica TaxID=49212 RepID=UPI0020095B9D|nr:receptor-like protein 33 isoform X1 [Salvia hispanica]
MAVSSLLSIIIFFFLFIIFVDGQCLDDQKKLLLELRSEFKFSSTLACGFGIWNETGDCCEWYSVECDDSGHVISLHLDWGISGRIGESSALFQLTYLSEIILSNNDFTTTQIPNQFHHLPNLAYLDLENSGFMGPIPSTLANLTQLVGLYLNNNFLTGSIPSFHNCKNLKIIGLSHNNLMGSLSDLHFKGLQNLSSIDLSYNSLNGTIPLHLFVLPSIDSLILSNNQFSGQINEVVPIIKHSNLNILDLGSNRIGGPIPNFFFQLRNLSDLRLPDNLFNGTFELNKIQSLTSLFELTLSNNNLSVDTTNMSSSSYNLIGLQLSSCNLYDFPDLRNASSLFVLNLSNNHLRGDIPSWIWETKKTYLDLSFNLLTGLKKPPISSNFIDSTVLLANNRLTGMIPSSFCNASFFRDLDFSFNNLSGSIPPCLIKKNLVSQVLNLRGNKISGVIPDQFSSGCDLETFDVSNNNLGGKVPMSLGNCTSLLVMNVADNNLEGSFPCMLSFSLRILVLRSNRFQGDLRCSKSWPDLQILDISSNSFSGHLNLLNFSSLRGMMLENSTHLNRSNSHFLGDDGFPGADIYYHNEVTLTVKGYEEKIVKIWPDFTCIDLSSNHFEGEIPDGIGNLTSLYLLNLSRNSLTDEIPRSLGALAELGSLDLSSNKLTGRIPDELAKLDFLSFLNVSYNHLTGPIPTGRQFQTFSADSFEGNAGLSGFPLNGSFNNRGPPGPSPSEDSKSKDDEIEWEYVFVASGYVVGIGSVAWTLLCCRRLRERYFEKIEEVADKIFYEIGRRKRHERRVRIREERNAVRRRHHQ